MAFKQYIGRGFMIFVEGPAGPDGRKRETSVVSCPAQDYPEVLKVVLADDGWIQQDESLVPVGSVALFVRPGPAKKNFTMRVEHREYLRTVVWAPDPRQPGKDPRDSIE